MGAGAAEPGVDGIVFVTLRAFHGFPPRVTSEAGQNLTDLRREGDCGLQRRKKRRGRQGTSGLDGGEGDRTAESTPNDPPPISLISRDLLARFLCVEWSNSHPLCTAV